MPSISDAEAQIMEVLWTTQPLAADEVAVALRGRQDWEMSTIKTLLNRLLKKGAIRARQDGRRFLYAPVLQRDDWAESQASSLLDRVFGGNLAALVAQFAGHRKLKPADVAAIKKLLQDYERG